MANRASSINTLVAVSALGAMRILTILVAVVGCRLPPGGMLSMPIQCSGGAELIANGCYCANGTQWNGLTCQGTPDPTGCAGGSFLFGPAGSSSCHCMLGTTLDSTGTCVALQCTGGAVAGDTECVCPADTQWDGSQCVGAQPQEVAVSDPPSTSCASGTVASGDQCLCPDGTSWDGTQCVSAPSAPPRSSRACRLLMIKKGYSPNDLANCDGVDDRCAVAMLNHGYSPHDVTNCQGVDGKCAEALLAKMGSPHDVANCPR
jgi:hypothetical protein